jgi:hypothetical protein
MINIIIVPCVSRSKLYSKKQHDWDKGLTWQRTMTCYRVVLPDASELLVDIVCGQDFRSTKMMLELEVFMLLGVSVDVVKILRPGTVITRNDTE